MVSQLLANHRSFVFAFGLFQRKTVFRIKMANVTRLIVRVLVILRADANLGAQALLIAYIEAKRGSHPNSLRAITLQETSSRMGLQLVCLLLFCATSLETIPLWV